MTVTLTTLLADVRERLDETTAAFWNDTALTRWINEAVTDVAKRSETLLATASIAVTAADGTYAAPVDMVRIHQMTFTPTGQTQVYPLRPATRQSLEHVWGTNPTQQGSYPSYFILWGFSPSVEIQLFPVPSQAGSLTVYYYKVPAALVSGGDVAAIPEGWQDLIPLYVEAVAKRKDHDPTWAEGMEMYETRLRTMCEQLRHLHDQQEYVTAASGIGVPSWLYSFDEF